MGLAKVKAAVSVEEYLANEIGSLEKHEFVDGNVYAMAGASNDHGRLVTELVTNLNVHLRSSDCDTYSSDMRVRVTEHVYYYPDVVVSCGGDIAHSHTLHRPILIAEVISPSTERTDRTEKLLYYLQLPSLKEYVIVDQRSMNVEVHRRQPNGGWTTHYFGGPDDAVELTSVDLNIPLSELYRRVQFEADAS
jgi:Uma2 family endonuclease